MHKGVPVEIGNFILGINVVDLLIIGFFGLFFVLGFAQGTIRRLIGIGSILFSFLFAANLSASRSVRSWAATGPSSRRSTPR